MGVGNPTGEATPGKNFGMRECRRYITSHNSEGKAIFTEEPRLLYKDFGSVAAAHAYAVPNIPAQMSNDADLKAYLTEDETSPASQYFLSNPVLPNGVNYIITNLSPGGSTGMHRTVSIDCTVCLEGHIGMEVDSGEVREFFAGDHVIQRGTAHRWINMSKDKPARIMGIVMGSEPILIGGQPLPQDM
ncbi:hypothetical protein NX059_006344 [Plenodomus lindquistii]|nr:hypothetical protein NX059_006344 [Plenodomus lindquistii]